MKHAVVLLSGGIDSSTTLAVAKNEGFTIHALSFQYGQRHGVEIKAAQQYAKLFIIEKHIIICFNMRDIGGSALTSDIEIPKKRQALSAHNNQQNLSHSTCSEFNVTGIPVTYVPARNTIFLSFALSLAESIGAEDIFIGVNSVDYSGYPDCRPEFIKAFEYLASLATRESVEKGTRFKVQTPLINLTKGEIIKKGLAFGVDYSLTWSCYDPQKKPDAGFYMSQSETANADAEFLRTGSEVYVPCMQCDSCILRAKGFQEAGREDPLLLKLNTVLNVKK
jgi:7-cyano-7-deazaguanine synthase